jgi:uncharacterized membrane protein
MLRSAARSLGLTLLAGVLAFLPLVLTVLLVGWVGDTLHDYLGPGSTIGEWLKRLGFSVVTSEGFAWAAGVGLLLAAVWTVGLMIRIHLLDWAFDLLDSLIQRVPLVGPVYGLAGRFAKLLAPQQGTDLHAMTPVWCLFGGQGGTAVLALMPSAEICVIEGARYRPVLIPSAPVPVGGGLLFLPEDWVKPAELKIEDLTSLYVSMGVALPAKLTRG